jgi:hypothetical protein
MIGLRKLSVACAMILGFVMATGAQATGYHHGHHHHHRHHVKHVKVVHVVHKVTVHKVHKAKAVRHAKHAKPKPMMHAKMKHHHHRHHYVHHRPAQPKPPALVLVKAGHPGKCGTFLYYSSKINGCADARAKA